MFHCVYITLLDFVLLSNSLNWITWVQNRASLFIIQSDIEWEREQESKNLCRSVQFSKNFLMVLFLWQCTVWQLYNSWNWIVCACTLFAQTWLECVWLLPECEIHQERETQTLTLESNLKNSKPKNFKPPKKLSHYKTLTLTKRVCVRSIHQYVIVVKFFFASLERKQNNKRNLQRS